MLQVPVGLPINYVLCVLADMLAWQVLLAVL